MTLLRERADEFARYFFSRLPDADQRVLRRDLPRYLDGHGNLYVRIGKQQLFDGVVTLSESDVLKLRFKPKRTGVHYDTTPTLLQLMGEA